MARSFRLKEVRDPDLGMLITDFLDRNQSYLPVESADKTLILMPCDNGSQFDSEAVLYDWLEEEGIEFEEEAIASQRPLIN